MLAPASAIYASTLYGAPFSHWWHLGLEAQLVSKPHLLQPQYGFLAAPEGGLEPTCFVPRGAIPEPWCLAKRSRAEALASNALSCWRCLLRWRGAVVLLDEDQPPSC